MPHGHSHCKHILKVCEPCDMAYCNKCNKEWGGSCHLSHYPHWTYPWYTTTQPWGTYTVSDPTTSTLGVLDSGTDTVDISGHNHVAVGS